MIGQALKDFPIHNLTMTQLPTMVTTIAQAGNSLMGQTNTAAQAQTDMNSLSNSTLFTSHMVYHDYNAT